MHSRNTPWIALAFLIITFLACEPNPVVYEPPTETVHLRENISATTFPGPCK